jgi:hypothetical protein
MGVRSRSPPAGPLDPASRARIRIFSLKLTVLTLSASLLAVRYHYPPFAMVSSGAFWYAAFAGLLALLHREPLAGPSLNGWDEVLAFLAIKALAQFLVAAAG